MNEGEGSGLSYADIVATAALGVSVVAIIWQGLRAWLDRPAISVNGEVSSERSAPTWDNSWRLSAVVANTGSRAATVSDAHWEIREPESDVCRHLELSDATLFRLEPNDHKEWSVTLPTSESGLLHHYGRPVVVMMKSPGLIGRLFSRGAKRVEIAGRWRFVDAPDEFLEAR